MKRIILSSILVILLVTVVRSQEILTGAKSAGMAHTVATSRNTWCIFQNIGGLAGVDQSSLLFGYENRYGSRDGLQTVGAGLVLPLKTGAGSVGVSRFGDQFLSVHAISLGYGHQIEQFSLGIRLSQQQYSLEHFGTRMLVVADVGGIATITPELVFGLQIKNISQATISRFTGERAPSLVQTGFSYRPLAQLRLNGEIEYEVNHDPVLKAGAEYVWEKKVSFRTGINNQHLQQFFGIGLAHRLLDIDYALSSHASLGFTHQVSLAYHVSKK